MFLPKNIRYFVIGTVRYLPALSLNDRIAAISIVLRWSHSVWRLLIVDLILFVSINIAISLGYHNFIRPSESAKAYFDGFVDYVIKIGSLVPLSFLLGFFVSTILTRWWQIIYAVPWMSTNAFHIQTFLAPSWKPLTDKMSVSQQNKELRIIRLTLVRFMNLAWIFQMIRLSRQVKRRFTPEEQQRHLCLCFLPGSFHKCAHLRNKHSRTVLSVRQRLEAINRDPVVMKFFKPLICPQEIDVFERMEAEYKTTSQGYYKPDAWLPLQWAVRVMNNAREMGLFRDDRHYTTLAKIMDDWRGALAQLYLYNEFNIPLGYTQVVVTAVYSFFLSELFSQQYLQTSANAAFRLETYLPLFSILKFLFYMGWFKMGLHLINPLSGEKSSAFPMSDILDFNLQISTQMAPADDIFYPEYMTSTAGDASEQIHLLNKLCQTKYDAEAGEGPSEEWPLCEPA